MTDLNRATYRLLPPGFSEVCNGSILTKDQALTLGGLIVAIENADSNGVYDALARYAKNEDPRIAEIALWLEEYARMYRDTDMAVDHATSIMDALSPLCETCDKEVASPSFTGVGQTGVPYRHCTDCGVGIIEQQAGAMAGLR